MEKIGNFLYNLISKHHRAIVLITLILTAFFGYGLSKLKMASEFTDDLPANDPIILTQKYFQDVFGDKDVLIIGIENPSGIYTPSTLQKLKDISAELKNIPAIIEEEITGLATANNIKGLEWGLAVGAFMKEVPQTEEELTRLRNDVRGNDMFYGRLVSKDETLTTIIANLHSESIQGEALDETMGQIQALVKRFEGPEKFYLNGDPVGSYEIDRGIQHDVRRLVPLAVILLLGQFFLAFRRIRGVVIPTLVMAVSIVWTMGLIGFLGYKINVVTSIIPVVMLAITSSYGIHIVFRYYEVMGAEGFSRQQNPAASAARRLTSSLLMAGLTSAIGSVTLMVFKVVSIKQFGVFLSIGIVIGFVLALTFAPALLFFLKPQSNKLLSDGSTSLTNRGDMFDRLIQGMIKLVLGRRLLISVVLGIILIISFIGIYRIKVGLNFIDFFPRNHVFSVAARKFNAQAGGTNPITIMVETPDPDGIKKPEVLKKMLALEDYARTLSDVGSTDSFARLIKRMHYVMNGEKKEFDVIPDSPELIAQYLLLYSISGNPGDFDNMVDYDYQRATVTINLTTFDQERQKEIFENIQKHIADNFPPEIKTAYDGLIYWVAQNNYLIKGKIQNMISSILIIFLFCTIAYRSFRFGIFSIIPLTIVTLFTFGMMGCLGMRLNMATAIITSIAVGVGVDFSIHYLTHYREELLKGLDYRAATVTTMTSTGKVIIIDGLSNVLGFIMFIGSRFVPVRNLGWLLSLNMITVSAVTLIILPVTLSFFDLNKLTAKLNLEKKGGHMLKRTKIRWAIISVGLIFWFLFTFNFAFSSEMTARQIMEKNDELQTSQDNFSRITMKLVNEKGQERVRKISYWEKDEPQKERMTLVKFQFPADVKGSGLLTLEHKEKDDDQWLFLPALRKTRRISSGDKGDSFMGSDFTFEDMERDNLDHFEYKLIGSEEIDGESCYRIEGESRTTNKNYSRREFLIRKNDFALTKIFFYDKKGNFSKTFTASDFSLINGKPRARKIIMENPQKKHRTELIYEEIKIDQGIPDNLFTERELIKE